MKLIPGMGYSSGSSPGPVKPGLSVLRTCIGETAYGVAGLIEKNARKEGFKIVTGTDGGPGSIMNELCLLVDCGLSPMDALVAATRSTADVLGVLHKTGTLEVGKSANLLVVDGDPTADITVLSSKDSICLVMKDGVIQMAGEADPNQTGTMSLR